MFDINIDELMASKRAQIEAREEQKKNLQSILLLLNEELRAASESLRSLDAFVEVTQVIWSDGPASEEVCCSIGVELVAPKWFEGGYFGKVSFSLSSRAGKFSCTYKDGNLYSRTSEGKSLTAGDALEFMLGWTERTIGMAVNRLANETVDRQLQSTQ